MNPKKFLKVGGGIMALLGVLGLLGVMDGMSWAYLIPGLLALVAAMACNPSQQRLTAKLLGLYLALAGLYALFVDSNLWGANFGTLDAVLYLAFGVWGFLSARGGKAAPAPAAPSAPVQQ